MGGPVVTECRDDRSRSEFYAVATQLARKGLTTDEQSPGETRRVVRLCRDEGKRFRLFVCRSKEGRPLCRCALSWREGWQTGHVGFFESDGDVAAVRALFAHVGEASSHMGLGSLVGPVNGSIWDGYRYKVAGFDKETYTCDRDTPQGYPSLWEAAGFVRTQTWHSDLIAHTLVGAPKAKLERRLRRAHDLGYRFEYVGKGGLSKGLSTLWALVMELYGSFPAYEPLSEAGFKSRFMRLNHMLDPQCALLAHDSGGTPVGFGIAIPDYAHAMEGARGPLRKAGAIAMTRVHPSRYVVAYVGVSKGHEGLGGALCALMARRQEELGAGGIAALIADGKPTASYAGEQGVRTWEYALYRR